MSAISSFVQPMKSLEAPEIAEQDWVSGLLRRASGGDRDRCGIVSTLADADLWRIWQGTQRRATARDRRTHEATGVELARRGLINTTQLPRRAAADVATADVTTADLTTGEDRTDVA